MTLRLAFTLGAAVLVFLAAAKPYPRQPFARYLMSNRDAEIALARSAAPAAVSSHATVLVLTESGYVTAVKGSNGFTCLVERAWTSPFDSSEFWSLKIRGPICYNAAAARTVLPYTLDRAALVRAGDSKTQMMTKIKAMVAAKRLLPPAVGAMAFMLSKHGYLADGAGAWVPHLMLYAPKADSRDNGASWGADVHGSPVIYNTQEHVVPEPETIFMVPVAHWSDGSPAST